MAKKPAKKAAKPAPKTTSSRKGGKAAKPAAKKVAKPAPKTTSSRTSGKLAKAPVKKVTSRPSGKPAAKPAPKAIKKVLTPVTKKAVPVKPAAKKATPTKALPKAAPKKAAPAKSVGKLATPLAKPTPAPKPVSASKVKPVATAEKAVKKETKKEEKAVQKETKNKPLVTQVVAPNRPMAAPVVKKQVSTLESADKLRYNDDELTEFRDLINKKLDEARKDYDLLKQTLANTDNNGTDDTSPSFKMIEDGSETLSREETAQLAGRQEKFIKHLEDALLRIRNKTYGICRVTGRLISKERLRLVPHATLSIEAKQQMGS